MQETLDFCSRVTPNEEEDQRRSAAHAQMLAACRAAKLFNLQPFGSRASGLELWDSDIDLVVLGVVQPSGENHSELQCTKLCILPGGCSDCAVRLLTYGPALPDYNLGHAGIGLEDHGRLLHERQHARAWCILVQIIALPFCTLQVVYLVFANAVGACAAFFEGEKEEVNFHLGRLCKQLRLTRAMQKMHHIRKARVPIVKVPPPVSFLLGATAMAEAVPL